ncbi:MAG: hypothetical protein NC253_08440 [Ruminococcus sp.]|nr:hypothetical protein [Ruminococcus sp.]
MSKKSKTKAIDLENLSDFKDNMKKIIPKVEESETNGNIRINDEEVQVYDDTEIKDKIDNLNPIPEEVGTEINPVYIANGEFKQTSYELATNVPPGGTNWQFLRGDGVWASPEYNPEVVVIDISFDKFLRMDTASSSMTKEVELMANKSYELYYNGFYGSKHYVVDYQCQVQITLEDNHEDKTNTNVKTILTTTETTPQVLNFSTEDYANPVLRIRYTYKIVPKLTNTTSYTKNNVVVKGAGNKFDWGKPQPLRLGEAIQFDTTALGNWSYFMMVNCDSDYQNQTYNSHNRTDNPAQRGDFYVEYDSTTKILTVCLCKVDIKSNKRNYIFYFDNAYNTCVAINTFATYSESYLKTYPYSMSLKRDYISIAEQRIDELETKVNTITKEDIVLGNVENKSSADIRGELTKSDVTTALGFTPPESDTTYSNFVKSGSGAKAGLVPAPSTTAGTAKFLCENATWKVPYGNMAGASSSADGAAGLVPKPTKGQQNYLLQGDGTWLNPSNLIAGSTTLTLRQSDYIAGSGTMIIDCNFTGCGILYLQASGVPELYVYFVTCYSGGGQIEWQSLTGKKGSFNITRDTASTLTITNTLNPYGWNVKFYQWNL